MELTDIGIDALKAGFLAERSIGATFSITERRARREAGAAQNAAFVEGLALPEIWAGVPCEVLMPIDARADRWIVYLHGGGYCLGSANTHRHLAMRLGKEAQAQVCFVGYRLAPEHPCPAALEDALAVYGHVLAHIQPDPTRVLVAGDSAGAGLAVALLARARAVGLAMPSCLYLMSPWVDLSQSGSSYNERAEIDPYCTRTMLDTYAQAYLGGAPADHPDASPVHADVSGLPKTLIQVGTDEILFSDSQSLLQKLRADGVEATCETWPQMTHVWQQFWPVLAEARDALEDAGKWIRRRLA